MDLAGLMDDDEMDDDDDLGESAGADISEEEMSALLGADTEEEEEEEEEAEPAPAPKKKARPKASAKKKEEVEDIEDLGNGEDSISQDEIDALFG